MVESLTFNGVDMRTVALELELLGEAELSDDTDQSEMEPEGRNLILLGPGQLIRQPVLAKSEVDRSRRRRRAAIFSSTWSIERCQKAQLPKDAKSESWCRLKSSGKKFL